jgi:hypothetical protein
LIQESVELRDMGENRKVKWFWPREWIRHFVEFLALSLVKIKKYVYKSI